jgi:hypothetical protein
MQAQASTVKSSPQPSVSIFNRYNPRQRLHNESRIPFVAKETLAIAIRLIQDATVVYVGASFALTSPPVAAMLVTGFALMYFHKKTPENLPKRITDLVNSGKILILAFPCTVASLAFLTFYNLTPIGIMLTVTIVTGQIFRHCRKPNEHIKIGSHKEKLNQDIIQKDLKAMIRDHRTIEHLELHHTGDTLFLNADIIEDLKKLSPKKMTLSGVNFEEGVLEQLNQTMTNDVQTPTNSKVKFYHYISTNENTQFFALSEFDFTLPSSKCEIALINQDWKKFRVLESFTKQLNHVRPKSFPFIVRFEVKPDRTEDVTPKMAITREDIETIMELNPTTILFDKNSRVDDEAREFLNTIRYEGDQRYYYKKIDAYHAEKTFIQDNDDYCIGYGEALTKESVIRRLEETHGLKIKMLTLNHRPTDKDNKFELTEEIVNMLIDLKPDGLEIAWGKYVISKECYERLNACIPQYDLEV